MPLPRNNTKRNKKLDFIQITGRILTLILYYSHTSTFNALHLYSEGREKQAPAQPQSHTPRDFYFFHPITNQFSLSNIFFDLLNYALKQASNVYS